MSLNLIKIGFDIHLEMTLNEIVEALKFCPIQYDIKQIESQYFFFEVDNSKEKNLILNFLNDYKLRKNLSERIGSEQKTFVDAIIKASISK